ncbi:Hypothetical predicted protein [Scomber scombrus]|uniref:Uncharacterized protein n=1 Tax=Scomber scombrus TaxID=13677 RepID=A0AAV1NM62_SCOSC
MEWVDPADQTVTTMALEQHEASGCQLQRSLRVRHKILQEKYLFLLEIPMKRRYTNKTPSEWLSTTQTSAWWTKDIKYCKNDCYDNPT